MKNEVKIRPLRKTDAPRLAILANDKSIWRNTLVMPYPYTEAHARKFLRDSSEQKRKGTNYVFAITYKKEFVGVVSLNKVDKEHRHCEIGYWLGSDYRGRGITTEAAKQICSWGQKRLKLKRIYGTVLVRNKASQRVLTKAGFKKEGILRSQWRKQGKFVDAVMMAKITP